MDKKIVKGYGRFFKEIKGEIQKRRNKVLRSVNKGLIDLYWEIGRMIVDRQQKYGWGKSVVEKLSIDLKQTFNSLNGYSSQNLWYMRQFYLEYKDSKKLQQLVGEIPWGQNILIFSKVKDLKEREYYLRTSFALGWSRNVLLNQIKSNAYQKERVTSKQHNFASALPVHLAEQADESIKSIYSLDFLGIGKPVLERELEGRLVEKVKQFILELGYGFSFIGNQYRLRLGNNDYFLDLLFFNRKLKCLVAVELKTGKFEPEYAGKMDFYLHLLNEQVKMKDENPSIGIILCAEKDNLVVEYSLRSVKNPVGISEYHLTSKLPKRLKGLLPSESEFKEIEKEL